MRFIIAALVIILAAPLLADDESNWYPYNRQFDKKVVLQGIGWGQGAKGLGIRVMTPGGVAVYFDAKDMRLAGEFKKWQGKLIEVTGILRKRTMKPGPKGAQGYSESFEYLVIEDAQIRAITKVERGLVAKAWVQE